MSEGCHNMMLSGDKDLLTTGIRDSGSVQAAKREI